MTCRYVLVFFFLMIRRPPGSTRTDTLFPDTSALPLCAGRDDHLRVVADEALLIVAPCLGVETRVIRRDANPVGPELGRNFIDTLARQAVNDAGATIARHRQQLRIGDRKSTRLNSSH